MKNKFRIKEEYSNNKRNLSVRINNSEIKESQLKMILNNDDISCLLSTKFMQTEESAYLYYDAKNMESLYEKFSVSKMNTSDFVVFVKNFLYMLDELEDYLLSSGGILTDCHYVYFDESSQGFKYIHIPTEYDDLNDKQIIEFISEVFELFYYDKYDDFAQEFLNTVNFAKNINDINKIISKYDDKSILGKIKTEMEASDNNANDEAESSSKPFFKPSFGKKSGNEPSFSDNSVPKKPTIGKNNASANAPKKPSIKKTEKSENSDQKENSNSSIKTTVFIAVQILIAAAVVKIALLGIEQTKLAALIILILVIDAIFAKEIFLKNKTAKPKEKKLKKEKAKKEKTVNEKKNTANKEKPTNMPKKEKIPEIPASKPRIHKDIPPLEKPEIPQTSQKNNLSSDMQNKESFINESKIDYEKTVLDTSAKIFQNKEAEQTAFMPKDSPLGYIEVYDKEGNITEKFIIKQERTVIGRLKSQVNLQLKSLMVGKIHAEITYKDKTLYVRDICSLNGTYIGENRKKINKDEMVAINSGETLYLADIKIKVYLI